jgi:hypothetical protein
MTKTEKILLVIAIFVALLGLATGIISYFFGVEVVVSGEAHGFRIGDDRKQTYENAQRLLEQKQIVAIHTWPKDKFYRPFGANENPEKNIDPRWVMVVNPDWWNNTINVTFENNIVAKIKRYRICCELP